MYFDTSCILRHDCSRYSGWHDPSYDVLGEDGEEGAKEEIQL